MFSKDQIRKGIETEVIVGDGHTLFRPDHYASLVSEESLRKARLVTTHKSDLSSPKSTIFDKDGNVIKSLTAVYNLTFLYWLASQVGVKYESYLGRGSQAQEIVRALDEWANS